MLKYKITNIFVKKIKKQGVKLVKTGELKAVHDDDLVQFLKSIEEYDNVMNGEAKCVFCDEKITLENIQSIFPLNGQIKYCCNSNECYRLLMEGSYGNA